MPSILKECIMTLIITPKTVIGNLSWGQIGFRINAVGIACYEPTVIHGDLPYELCVSVNNEENTYAIDELPFNGIIDFNGHQATFCITEYQT